MIRNELAEVVPVRSVNFVLDGAFSSNVNWENKHRGFNGEHFEHADLLRSRSS